MSRRRSDQGFTVIELLVVVGIMGILVATAVPVFLSTRVKAAEKTCYSNQRMIEGAVGVWLGVASTRGETDLQGVVNGSHPLVVENIVGRVPCCPAGPGAADSSNPTPAEGAYTLGPSGTLEPCAFGDLGVHGHY